MSETRAEPRRRLLILNTPVTLALLALNITVFLGQYYLEHAADTRAALITAFGIHLPHSLIPGPQWVYWLGDHFALSLDGLKAGRIWQLLTFQFLHGGWAHLLLNSWAIFVFGPVVEYTLGWKRMLSLYLTSGVIGGLTQILGIVVFPRLFEDTGVVGASAGVFGLMAAFASFYPREKLYLLLFFVIPMSLRARTLLVVLAILSLAGILYPIWQPLLEHQALTLRLAHLIDPLFANIGHAAHLGGLLAGLGLSFFFKNRRRRVPVAAPPVSQAVTPEPPYVQPDVQ